MRTFHAEITWDVSFERGCHGHGRCCTCSIHGETKLLEEHNLRRSDSSQQTIPARKMYIRTGGVPYFVLVDTFEGANVITCSAMLVPGVHTTKYGAPTKHDHMGEAQRTQQPSSINNIFAIYTMGFSESQQGLCMG